MNPPDVFTKLEGDAMTRQCSFPMAGLTATALMLALSGCSMSYNGAWSTKPEVAAERALQEHQQQTAMRRGAFNDAQAQLMPASFPAPSDPATMDRRPRGSSGEMISARPTWDGNFGLFGDLPSLRRVNSPADSTSTARQISFATEGADLDPAIDPTGKWIAFASTRHRPTFDIYLQAVDGTSVTQLTGDPASDRMPVFSPDGRRIAFCSDRSGNWDIYMMDLDGSGQTVRLTDDPADEIHPTFSPDGKRLAYCAATGELGDWELVIVDLDNSRAARRFIGQHGLFPQWSPSGDKLMFQRARERGSAYFSLWTVDIVGDEARRATEIVSSSNAGVINPAWSPDGKHMVFCTVVNPPTDDRTKPLHADVWMVDADGRNRSNLTNSRFLNYQPVWSSDGWIYFVSNRGLGGTETIWALRPDAALHVAKMSNGKPGMAAKTTESPSQTPSGQALETRRHEAADSSMEEVAAPAQMPGQMQATVPDSQGDR